MNCYEFGEYFADINEVELKIIENLWKFYDLHVPIIDLFCFALHFILILKQLTMLITAGKIKIGQRKPKKNKVAVYRTQCRHTVTLRPQPNLALLLARDLDLWSPAPIIMRTPGCPQIIVFTKFGDSGLIRFWVMVRKDIHTQTDRQTYTALTAWLSFHFVGLSNDDLSDTKYNHALLLRRMTD